MSSSTKQEFLEKLSTLMMEYAVEIFPNQTGPGLCIEFQCLEQLNVVTIEGRFITGTVQAAADEIMLRDLKQKGIEIPLDWKEPNWLSRERRWGDWKSEVTTVLRGAWSSFTNQQKALLAAAALSRASVSQPG